MLTLETPELPGVLAWAKIAWADECSAKESSSPGGSLALQASVPLAEFRSKANLPIEVVELCEGLFEDLVHMYDVFEPKRAAQGLPPVGRERIAAWLRHLQKNGENLLALCKGRVIGHSMLCPVDARRAEFAIFLHQDFRNQGIGTGLTAITLDRARLKGFQRIWLSVEVNNRCAIRVYRKKGFRVSALFGPEQEMVLDLEREQEGEVRSHEPQP